MIVGIGLDVVEVTKVRELLAGQRTFEERGVSFLQVEVQRGDAAAAVILEG